MLWIAAAHAADFTVGGAVDATAGVAVVDQAAAGSASLRQVEGDVQLGGDALNLRADIDFSLVWNGTVALAGVSPEWLALRGESDTFHAQAGFFPAPWHGEARDPWEEPLVSFGETDDVLPHALVGASAGWGDDTFSVDGVIGLEGAPLDFVHPDALGLRSSDVVLGAHAGLDTDVVDVGGGVYTAPYREAWFGAQLDARADIGVVRLFGEGVYAERAWGGQIRGEVFPDGTLSPVARVEYVQGLGPGGALGISSTFAKMLRAKVEGSYREGVPGVYAELAIFGSTAKDRPETAR